MGDLTEFNDSQITCVKQISELTAQLILYLHSYRTLPTIAHRGINAAFSRGLPFACCLPTIRFLPTSDLLLITYRNRAANSEQGAVDPHKLLEDIKPDTVSITIIQEEEAQEHQPTQWRRLAPQPMPST
ncbi:hypothetical protein RR48_07070 [Papilio machaon]|uniref:Uncharacterized protein n=1 Tax=Papilio machaon TaxID=76193 RepID=A0A194R8A8_PAPMA|nr:hypothetical protein RR48_07070 [Papilio machaon]